MGELVITTSGLALSVAAIGEALSMVLVLGTIGASAALVLYVLLKHTDNEFKIKLRGRDLITALQ